MRNKAQDEKHRSLTSRMRPRAVTPAMTLVGMLMAGMFAALSTQAQTFATLHSFDNTDGVQPINTLVQAIDGSIYGSAYTGGVNGGGTLFKITPRGALTTLYSLCVNSGCPDGDVPWYGELVQHTNGKIYGTTYNGGTSGACSGGCGTVFSVSVGLGPFVETRPTSSLVGAAVEILGTNLTGATSVTFNGTAAVFTVVSPSLITTTAPAGATSGKVQVTTPGATLTSNVSFRVRP